MLFRPKPLGKHPLDQSELVWDKKHCKKFGPCGVGERALYLNSFFIDRMYYVRFSSVRRIFKRVAMSKGGFTGKGMFASIPYLVVEYGDGKIKQCNFKREEHVDALLNYVRKTHPNIPLYSEAVEKKMKAKEALLAKRLAKLEAASSREEIKALKRCQEYLEKKQELADALSYAARRKRVFERSNPMYKWVALFIVLLGTAALLYGVYGLVAKLGFAMYFLLFGMAAIFMFAGANVLPTAKNNRKAIEKQLNHATKAMERHIAKMKNFPLPARYAHPIVIKRMIWILADNRANSIEEAFEVLKKDLKALNASVKVEQEEYDEVVTIKPMFLVHDYR